MNVNTVKNHLREDHVNVDRTNIALVDVQF